MLQIILSTILLCNSPSLQGWKGIAPLHSSRADVERLLGSPTGPCKHLCSYKTKNEVILVGYSGDPCTNNDDNRWRVPPDTVISVTVNLEEGPRFSSLKLDRKKFTKTDDPELHGYTSHTSAELGVDYSVNEEGRVFSIEWFPTDRDEIGLQCYEGDVGFLKIDAYGNINTKEESRRLDEFATRLKTEPPIPAYIVAYGGRNSWLGEAKYRANCVKQYLVKKHKIAERWITTIDGGFQEEAIVELYISLTGDPPITSPTLDPKDVRIIKDRAMISLGKCRLN